MLNLPVEPLLKPLHPLTFRLCPQPRYYQTTCNRYNPLFTLMVYFDELTKKQATLELLYLCYERRNSLQGTRC